MPTWIDFNSNYLTASGPELSSDLAAIQNSIENILSTPLGSRPMEREYGSKLYYFVHEPMDIVTEEDIRVSLIQALERWEPRITIDYRKTSVTQAPLENGYVVEIFFSIIVPSIQASARFTVKRLQ